MSKMFNLMKNWYDTGRWSAKRIGEAVEKGWLTADEYQQITGEVYKENNG
jgi:hypothetical protein